MTEDFLHYIWKYRLYSTQNLKTCEGEDIVVLSPGTHNTNGGPDFLNARIRLGNQLWAGHVEIHIRSGDWMKHGHQHDDHYKNVILHVVFEDDLPVVLHQQGDLPVLDISKHIHQNQWNRYKEWMINKNWIPCQSMLSGADEMTWTAWKQRLLVERLENKSNDIIRALAACHYDWSEVFYRKLARNFGFKINSDAFEMLAERLPLSILAKHKSDPFQIEALLFGQSGLLDKAPDDDYAKSLRREYDFLARKYTLVPMKHEVWNFARMRPSNFPTIRIAQFASLISNSDHLFSKLLEAETDDQIRSFFETETSRYWHNHFVFGKLISDETPLPIPAPLDLPWRERLSGKSGPEQEGRRMGRTSVENILINTVAPILFAYGRSKDEEKYLIRSQEILDLCPAESNKIISNWERLKQKSISAFDSQALIQLYNGYCIEKKCLHCMIGLKLIRE